MITVTVYADDGEYSETAETIELALAQFRQRRPDAIVSAVVDNAMYPPLVIAEG